VTVLGKDGEAIAHGCASGRHPWAPENPRDGTARVGPDEDQRAQLAGLLRQLGGKDYFAADREAADKVLAVNPSIRTAVRENRAFLGRTAYIHADLRQPEEILSHPVIRDVLDFTQPVALMLLAILHFIADGDKLAGIMATLPAGRGARLGVATRRARPAPDSGRGRLLRRGRREALTSRRERSARRICHAGTASGGTRSTRAARARSPRPARSAR
jgi:hypothetical protein